MDDDEAKRILAEAKANLADKGKLCNPLPGFTDPLAKWKADAERFERDVEAAKRERRSSERRRQQEREAQAQASSFTAWDEWFLTRLQHHWMVCAEPTISAIAKGTREQLAEIRELYTTREQILKQQHDIEISELKIELATLARQFAELKADLVLNGLPQSRVLRAVN